MNHDLQVSHTVRVNAPAEKVWRALTDPEIIKEYLFGTQTVTDWKVGSDIVFQGEYENTSYRDKGVVITFDPLKRIQYSYWSAFSGVDDVPENYSLITYDVVKQTDNTTAFTWTQRGYVSEDGYNHSKNGMEAFMNQIKAIIERP